jgi:prolyl-tRNA synthetase
MRFSKYFLHTIKETPAEACVVSHQLMLRAGLIHQTFNGVYSWLPLGLRLLEKITKIIAQEQDKIGCHRICMPTIQPSSLWKESGRYEAYGKEMLRFKDRHDKEMLYGPTHEEVVTDIMRTFVKSYRDLPQTLYQISPKFRDEIRPRFGVMRAREFLMKDGYSFDLDYTSAKKTYEKIFNSYIKIFDRIGVKAIPVKADSGAIGGDLSHEFHIMAETGESALYFDEQFETIQERTFETLSNLYAATDEKHNPSQAPKNLKTARGIEIGHIFYFGQKYSHSMNLKIAGPNKDWITPEMGSYGIGVSRLVGAIIEAHYDKDGISWPLSVAPFHVGLLQLKMNDEQATQKATHIYQSLQNAGLEVLYDDRETTAGVKFSDMDLIGLPYQIVLGKETGELLEIKERTTQEKKLMSLDALICDVKKKISVFDL